ncbi:MAG: heavy metal translocating P-type ATPase metal-binding domain-containing protein [Ignavibacteriaceae bacterium]|nr:heavy metal translocating P-type ATPase metal-binding domain-containing protein [Ignavibacteriaceae bacterium]
MTTEVNDTQTVLKCYHCGDICADDSIKSEDMYFCCEGCKIVYEVLNNNNLCTYYDLNSHPGNDQKGKAQGKNYDYLDSDEIRSKIVEFSTEQITRVTFFIPGMHCSSCIWLLEQLHKFEPSILESRVNFMAKTLSVRFSNNIKLSQVVTLLDSIGYQPRLSLDELEKKESAFKDKSLIYKIGISGFAFGNIMMLSFPEYLSIDVSSTDLKFLFNALIILLSLPVLVYCSSDYFKSAFKSIKQRFINIDVPLTLGIIALYGQSVYEIAAGHGAGYMDSFAGLIFFLLLGKIFQNKTYEFFSFERNYKSYFPISVAVLKDGDEIYTPLSQLKQGDKVVIRNNEIIPADAYLLTGDANIDYSFVTGESDPVQKNPGEKLFAGGKQTGGLITIEVMNEVSQSYLNRLWNNYLLTGSNETGYTHLSNVISKYFTIVILIIGAASFLFWLPQGIQKAITVFSAVLIVACPCALALSTPFTLGNALRLLGRNNFYMKNALLIETLSKIDTIVFDKTGTLTQTGAADITFEGKPLTTLETGIIKSMFRNSLHPLSKLVHSALNNAGYVVIDSFRETAGKGIECRYEGIEIRAGNSEFTGAGELSTVTQAEFTNSTGSRIWLKFGDTLRGYFTVTSKLRANLDELFGKLKNEYDIYLLSGDSEKEKIRFEKNFGEGRMFFNQKPETKKIFIENLKNEKKRVMMIGDGLNDSGAISSADIGVSVTDDLMSFTPASDVILKSDGLKNLSGYLKFAKSSVNVIKFSFVVSTIYNLIGLTVAVTGNLSPLFAAVLMPLSSITVIAIATVGTIFANKRRGLEL